VGSHGGDLDLARLCAAGDELAWERFVREYRPLLYRAADALDATGGAREVADSLYADLYGLPRGDGHSVLVLPGLLADDISTHALRTALRKLGYDVHGLPA